MYNEEQIQQKRELARTAHLSGAELLDDAERACEVCNGIGAEWMPAKLRERIGRRFPTLVLAADIHDLRYAAGGDETARQAADVEMLDNGVKLANHRYRWFDVRRYVLQFAMLQFYLTLRKCGQFAFHAQENEEEAR